MNFTETLVMGIALCGTVISMLIAFVTLIRFFSNDMGPTGFIGGIIAAICFFGLTFSIGGFFAGKGSALIILSILCLIFVIIGLLMFTKDHKENKK